MSKYTDNLFKVILIPADYDKELLADTHLCEILSNFGTKIEYCSDIDCRNCPFLNDRNLNTVRTIVDEN